MAVETHSESSGEPGARPPEQADITKLCAQLNRVGARYVVVGGFAIIHAGYPRFTEDLDLLIETTLENESKILEVLKKLPDAAASQVRAGEVAQYGVVRVSDEILVDLMKSGCGVTYDDAIKDAVWKELDGVSIPFASKSTLWKMKQTLREKDVPDRLFLRRALEQEGIPLDPPLPEPPDPLGGLPRWARWFIRKFSSKQPDGR